MSNELETGDTILLDYGKTSKHLVVEKLSDKFLLAEEHSPYRRLHVSVSRDRLAAICFVSGTPCRNNTFRLKELPVGKCRFVATIRSGESDIEYSIGLDSNGQFIPIQNASEGDELSESSFVLSKATLKNGVLSHCPLHCAPRQYEKWELRRFVLEGYLHLGSVLDEERAAACIAALNHELGRPGKVVDGGIQEGHGLGKLAGDLSNCSAVRDLLQGKVAAAIDGLFGEHSCERANLSAQIAFRFPEPPSPTSASPLVWHTDGLRQGQSHGFSLLLGVCLSDITGDNQGNLAVWPSSHLLLHQCKIAPHGALDLRKLGAITASSKSFENMRCLSSGGGCGAEDSTTAAAAAAAAGDCAQAEAEPHHNNVPALPSLGEPLQLRMKVGDIVVLHPDLAHAGAPNLHCEVRRMLYFRLRAKVGARPGALFASWEEAVQRHERDMWADLPALRRELGDAELDALTELYTRPQQQAATRS